ncbi:VOC family protein [Flammeovirga aprica]|uniref:VOC family protein n=1 Tax=Flammeovirga aprica JL-4 TaxID=694437 RepID=A0A7X9P3K1_9BACT|nr:VOC family protein [Flammeovirga aprica]NME68024.1 VOC family protein [Flammeovirga aprica JL-4]
MESKGIPGKKGIDHFGFTVPNLKEAVDFFVNVIGAEVSYKIGPFASDDDWMKKHLGLHPRTKIPDIAIVQCGNGSNIEIFEYVSPEGEQEQKMPKNCDWGGRHLAFYVEDMDLAVQYLKDQGLEVQGEPTIMTEGPSAGETWVYFLSPWGMQLELVSFPNGKAYNNYKTE